MEDYPNNSNKFKQNSLDAPSMNEPKKNSPVPLTGTIRPRQGPVNKVLGTLFVADMKTIGMSVIKDVVVPSIKKLLYESVTNGLQMGMWGDTYNPRSNSNRIGSSIDYNGMSTRVFNNGNHITVNRTYGYNDWVFENRSDAVAKLEELNDRLSEFKIVSVADFYDIIGKTPQHTDVNYGWRNLSEAKVVATPDGGFSIRLPKAKVIN